MSFSSTHPHLFFFLLLLLPLSVTPTSFDYPTFDSNNFHDDTNNCPEGTQKICLKGNATFASSDQAIQLTNSISSSGWATYSDPIPLWKWLESNTTTTPGTGDRQKVVSNFTTKFYVNLTKHSPMSCLDKLSDGLAFSLSPYPHTIHPLSDDGMLGLVGRPHMFNASSEGGFVAVEIDTYQNRDWDPPSAHLGIDVNSIRSVVNQSLTNLTDLSDNKLDVLGEVTVDYDSTTGNLTATVTRGNTTFAQVSHSLDISTILPQLIAVSLSSTTGYCTEHHRVTSWSFNSSWVHHVSSSGNKKTKKTAIAASVAGLFVAFVAVVVVVAWWRCRRRKSKRTHEEEEEDAEEEEEELVFAGGPRRLEHEELVAATANFADERKLGAGGSGAVYRGFLGGDLKRDVAIKRVTSSGDMERGKKEYAAEVKIISQLRHRNLVQLVGWSHERGGGRDFLLVYELMENLSLDRHLFFDVEKRAPLEWKVRYNIVRGIASALLYLHEEGDNCVVHRDIKSSNVMLDGKFNAKVGDFGLARLTAHGHGLETTMLGGTFGYMAPECFYTGKASVESDVYAFGVVALEIATGRRAIEEDREKKGNKLRLVGWVWDFFRKGAILEAADPRLDYSGSVDLNQLERLMVVGLWCGNPDSTHRPSIRKAMAALNFEDVKIDLPREMPVAVYAPPPPPPLPTTGEGGGGGGAAAATDVISTSSSSLVDYTVSSLYSVGR